MNIQELMDQAPVPKFQVGNIVRRRPTRSENDGKRGRVSHIKNIQGAISYLVAWEEPSQWPLTAETEGDLVKVE